MDRRHQLLMMRDILDHLTESFSQWEDSDGRPASYLVDTMERDVGEFQRLFRMLRSESSWRRPGCLVGA